MNTRPKIELKNIKHSEFASQETNCYQATIYVDGVKFATVENDGHGGCDNVYVLGGHGHHAIQELEARIKATMPRIKSEYFPEGLEPNLEIICGDLVEEFLKKKQFRNLLKKVVLVEPSGKVFHYAAKFKPTPESISRIMVKNPTARCLNSMPEAEAFEILANI